MKSGINVQLASRVAGIPPRRDLFRWIRAACDCVPAQLTLRVVNASEARALNRNYRARDYAPNVLTFAYGGDPPAADVVICAQVAAQEAREQGKTREAHYAHLTVHGVLHALGMDHRTLREARVMEGRETAILRALGFADPYRSDRSAQNPAAR
ncbi:MAG: rRNA maturation RNase YbeY [Burkholderiales bacterium]|nr:rRNA maturation RNase YbeY [Burkholderiales bacterium]